jgi:hypothetical protein
MITKSFVPNRIALITLIAACLVVLISLGIRQTFGLFFLYLLYNFPSSALEYGNNAILVPLYQTQRVLLFQ